MRSGANVRMGELMTMWSSSVATVVDVTGSSFGTTTGLVFGAKVSSGNLILTGSATSGNWTLKTIIRAI